MTDYEGAGTQHRGRCADEAQACASPKGAGGRLGFSGAAAEPRLRGNTGAKRDLANLKKEHDHHLSLLQRFPLVQPILAKNMGLLRSLRGEESNANHMASETCGFPLHFWMSPVSGKEKFLFI